MANATLEKPKTDFAELPAEPTMYEIKPGDAVVHDVKTGCWFKCSEDQAVSYWRNIVAVAKEGRLYSDGLGVKHADLPHVETKRFWQDPNRPQTLRNMKDVRDELQREADSLRGNPLSGAQSMRNY